MRLAILFAFLAAACGNSFDKAEYVNGLRVLAVKAEPPEVAPGQSTQLSVLAVDTANRPVTLTWAACTLYPKAGYGVINPDCFTGNTGLVALGQVRRDGDRYCLGGNRSALRIAHAVDHMQRAVIDSAGGSRIQVIAFNQSDAHASIRPGENHRVGPRRESGNDG